MKKQITAAILFCFILISCKKEQVPENPIMEKEAITANKLTQTAPKPPIYVTMPVATVHNTVWISFGWEYLNGDGKTITIMNFHFGGGAGGGTGTGSNIVNGHEYTAQQIKWENNKDPNVVHITVNATDSYYQMMNVGGTPSATIAENIILFISYNLQTKAYTVSVTPNGKPYFVN